MLQQQLKEATAHLHAELEQLMFVDQIMDKTLTVEQYAKLLLVNFKLHNALEPVIEQFLDNNAKQEIDFSRRIKTTSLSTDLRELDLQENILTEQFDALGNFIDNPAKAFGAIYVLEGSSIGGQVIFKKLQVNANIPKNLSFKFYSHYGDKTMEMWKNFVAYLNQLPATWQKDAISGAVETFETIKMVANEISQPQILDKQQYS